MATDNPTPPEGAKKLASDDEDNDQFSLSPGEEITARVLTMRRVETEFGESGVLTLELQEDGEVVDYFAKDEVKQAFNAERIERGDTLWIAKGVDEKEIEGNSYHPTMCRQIEAGGN